MVRIEPGFLKKYYEKEADAVDHQDVYLKGSAWSLHYHGARLREILHYLAKAPEGVFLDVGCAEGLYVDAFRRLHPNSVSIGVDVSSGYLRKAKTRTTGAEWIVADAQCLPFRDEAIDFALCSEVMEHLPDARRCLEELVRISKGYFLISFPMVSPYRTLATRLRLFRELGDPFYALCSGHITTLNLRDVANWCQGLSCSVQDATSLCFLVPEKLAMKLRVPDFLCAVVSKIDLFISHLVDGRIGRTAPTPDCTIVALLRKKARTASCRQ